MFNFYKNNKNDLWKIIKRTATRKNIDTSYIEKDMWVCLTLDYLFNKCKYKDLLVFAGGTCLSKCYHIINRFSEDIDIALYWNVIGYDSDLREKRTNSQRDKLIKNIKKRTSSFLEEKLLPIIKKDFETLLDKDNKITFQYKDDSIYINYPHLFQYQYINPEIKIEIGTLSAIKPKEKISVVPYIQEIYPDAFKFERIQTYSISPTRIFWDKVTILHQEAHRSSDAKFAERCARHYYDLYCLSNNKEIKNKAIKDKKLLKDVINFKLMFYPKPWAKYEECLEHKIKLIPSQDRLKRIKEDYIQMNGMFLEKQVAFDKIVKHLQNLEKELNKK